MCDEFGQPKFPFSYLEYLMLLTLAQARLSPLIRICSGGSLLLTLITIFNSSRDSPELVPYVKMAKICPIFETNSLLSAELHSARLATPSTCAFWPLGVVVKLSASMEQTGKLCAEQALHDKASF